MLYLPKNNYYLYYTKKTERKVEARSDEEERNVFVTREGASSVLEEKLTLSKYMSQAKKNMLMTDGLLLALIYVFGLTCLIYPGLALDCTINFLSSIKNYQSWEVIFVQAIFNLGDAVGRYMGGI